MARPLRIQYPGAFYHVTCRGNERKKIFLDDEDRLRFLALLAESLEIYRVVLHAYAMMTNHFHLLIETVNANLSEFMRRFNIAYTSWFNNHHRRCGHLYQGRYKAFVVDADNYLLGLSRYLHLNCVRTGDLRSVGYNEQWVCLADYRWSSLPGYLYEKKVVNFVEYDLVLSLAGGRRAYREFMSTGLRAGVGNPFEDIKHQAILGDDTFVTRVTGEYLERGSIREQPSYRGLVMKRVEPEIIMKCVTETTGVDRALLSARQTEGVIRGIAAELLYRYSCLTEGEIGSLLGGIDYSAVSQLRRRLKERMKTDGRIMKCYTKAKRQLSKVKI